MIREVKEELGLDVKFEMIINFKEITQFRGNSVHLYFLGLVSIEDEEQEMNVDWWEIKEVKWADAVFYWFYSFRISSNMFWITILMVLLVLKIATN